MNPLISVIVPVYNVEKFLNQCVDSILAQTYKNFELILVDDGSKDKSGDICDDYAEKDPRIRVFHKENGGVSSARNCGLDNARGEYVCFVDSDDWVHNTYIEDMVKPEMYDLVIQGFKDGNITKKYSIEYITNQIEILDAFIYHLLKQDGPSHIIYSKLYKSSIIEINKLRFDENIWLGEDLLFNLQFISYSKNVYFTNTYSYVHRQLTESLTGKFICTEDLLIRANKFEETAKEISDNTRFPKLYYVIISQIIEGLLRRCYRVTRIKKERFMAYSFIKQYGESEMFRYMSFPYSKFMIFLRLPFALADALLVGIFKIMNKIKKAPQY